MANYIKDSKGLVRATTTTNLELEKPLTNDNYDIGVHNRNMDKLDVAINNVKNEVSSMEFVSTKVIRPNKQTVEASLVANENSIDNHSGRISDNETSILNLQKSDGDLKTLKTTDKSNLVNAINELFQNANNGKEIIANAIGNPLVSSDTFESMGSKIDTLTDLFRNVLIGKGVTINNDKLNDLINKVTEISTKKEMPAGCEMGSLFTKIFSIHGSNYYHHIVNIIDDNMYLISGIVSDAVTPDTEPYSYKYNLTTGTKTSIAGIRRIRCGGGVVIGDSIHMFGGQEYGSPFINKHTIYNSLANTYTEDTVMPRVSAYHTTVDTNDNIYLINTMISTSSSNRKGEVLCYNKLTGTYTDKSPMLGGGRQENMNFNAFYHQGYIYAFGGRKNGTTSQTLDVLRYDTNSDSWEIYDNQPSLISKFVCTNDGYIHSIDQDKVCSYDILNKKVYETNSTIVLPTKTDGRLYMDNKSLYVDSKNNGVMYNNILYFPTLYNVAVWLYDKKDLNIQGV